MRRRLIGLLAVFIAGALYWSLLRAIDGAREPWDAAGYWIVWYPGSLALSALAGWCARGRGWAAGVLFTGAQLPFLWLHNGSDASWPFGVLLLCLLALPAAGLSWLADRIAQRTRTESGFFSAPRERRR